jgi:type I restriction enzyme M protein
MIYAHHMKDARFTIPTPALLAKVVDMLDHVPMEEPARLYKSPFTDLTQRGPEGLFKSVQMDELIRVLEAVLATASAA